MRELARLTLTDSGGRLARDAHDLHVTLMRAFPDDTGGRAGVNLLYRVEGERAVLAQYEAPADWGRLTGIVGGVDTRDAEAAHAAIRAGQQLKFLIHANPTFDGVVDGKRRRTGIRDPARQRAWIERKLGDGGCRLLEVDGQPQLVIGDTWLQRTRRSGERLTHNGVEFRGVLVVDDPHALRVALQRGIGRGKAYGFGLLSVAR